MAFCMRGDDEYMLDRSLFPLNGTRKGQGNLRKLIYILINLF
jgi:hypothetical protein